MDTRLLLGLADSGSVQTPQDPQSENVMVAFVQEHEGEP